MLVTNNGISCLPLLKLQIMSKGRTKVIKNTSLIIEQYSHGDMELHYFQFSFRSNHGTSFYHDKSMRFYKNPRTFVEDHLIDDDKERLVLCRLMMKPCFVIGSNPMVRQFLCGPPQHTADGPPEQHNKGKWTISFYCKQSICNLLS